MMETPAEGSPGLKKRDSVGLGAAGGKDGRQSFSCAECRRLKLKCSRTWPCTSCEKRGCAQICPNGEMRTGKGKRLILANTEELHQRIAQLELALAQAHAKSTDAPHPLLSQTYLYAPRRAAAAAPPASADDEVVNAALGTLTIGDAGEAHFVGSFAGSEYLHDEGASPRSPEAPLVQPYPSQAYDGAALHDAYVPVAPGGTRDVRALQEQLPDWDAEGRALVESYWENVNWMYQILPRAMFEGDHLLNAYDTEASPSAHKLACVFLVMAIGVMFDLNRQPWDPRGERLFALGRACLSLQGLERASPPTVQALHLMGTYVLNDKRGDGAEVFWPVLGSAVKVAQSLGLHRDGTAFGLSPYEVEERRQVYWEVVTYDRLQALCFGRPCATSNRAADAKLPEPDGVLIVDDDGYHGAKYKLIEMMEAVIDIQTQIKPVTYSAVTALDAEIIEFKKTLPDSLLPHTPIQDLPLDRLIHPHLVIHRLGIRLLVAQTRLLLNRPSFAAALKERPDDPSRSRFATSFVALYESAHEIVQLVKQLVIYHPSLIARWWFFWFHAFSSAVCLSAIAIRAPGCAFASPAYQGMSVVCDISAAARAGCRAKTGLPVLQRLRARALAALAAAARSRGAPAAAAGTDGVADDDLSHLAFGAKLVRLTPSAGASPASGGIATAGAGAATASPLSASTGSAATSATYAELDLGAAAGAAPPPPPPLAARPPGAPGTLDPHAAQLMGGLLSPPPTAGWLDFLAPISPAWDGAAGAAAFAPGPSPDRAAHVDLRPPPMAGPLDGLPDWARAAAAAAPARHELGPGPMDADMSMALGIDLSTMAADGDGLGFDFEAFVNQMGGG